MRNSTWSQKRLFSDLWKLILKLEIVLKFDPCWLNGRNHESCPRRKKVYQIELNPAEEEWLVSYVFKKIVLYVHTEEELLKVYEKAREAGLIVELITDSGIGPDDPERIDQITGNLPMY